MQACCRTLNIVNEVIGKICRKIWAIDFSVNTLELGDKNGKN